MTRLALAALVASLTSITAFAAAFSGLAILAVPDARTGYVDGFVNVLVHALAIFLLPAVAICAGTGFLLVRQARTTGRVSGGPFVGWGMLIGLLSVGGLWWAMIGNDWQLADILMIPAGAVVGLSGGAAFWTVARACGLMSQAAQPRVRADGP